MENSEIWKDIKGYEGCYQISNFGRFKSLERNDLGKRTVSEKIRKQSECGRGYLKVGITKNNIPKTFLIHQLVWNYFGNSEVSQGMTIDHKDENKHNNHIDNLQLLPYRENTIKSRKKRNIPTGVYLNKRGRCKAVIVQNKKVYYLGRFDTPEQAGIAYQKAKSVFS